MSASLNIRGTLRRGPTQRARYSSSLAGVPIFRQRQLRAYRPLVNQRKCRGLLSDRRGEHLVGLRSISVCSVSVHGLKFSATDVTGSSQHFFAPALLVISDELEVL